MQKNQWNLIKAIFEQVTELNRGQQAEFIRQQAKGDAFIEQKVLAMLAQSTSTLTDTLNNIVDNSVEHLIGTEPVLTVGDKIEQFRVIAPLGQGGMGSIFLAEREGADFEQNVAIKVIHSKQLTTESENLFKRERKILASLNHKNIASFIGGGQTEQGYPYIILEFIEGIPIDDYCYKHQLSIVQVLQLFVQVLNAVSYAHQNLVVHRDIKPSNVLVTESGDVKLLDFGIAAYLHNTGQDDSLDTNKDKLRALSYVSASPEQIMGQSVTTLTDIYGLGALLFTMLTEQTVFEIVSQSNKELETKILSEAPKSVSTVCAASVQQSPKARSKSITADLDSIVAKALEKSPDNRYASAEQFAQDIQSFLTNYPVLARPAGRWHSITKFVQRNRMSSYLTGVLAVGLITSSLVINHQSAKIAVERNTALEQAMIARQTLNYLNDMFLAADPNINDGETFTAKMLLDQAKTNIDGLEVNPSIKAELLLTLSRVYLQIGEYGNAIALQSPLNKLIVSDSLSQARAKELSVMFLENTANLNSFLGEYEIALEQSNELIDLLTEIKRSSNQFNIDVNEYDIKALYSKATALGALDRYQESIIAYQQSLNIIRLNQFEEKYLSANYLGLGHSLRKNRQFEKSIDALTLGIEAERQYQVKETLELAHGLNQLASTLLSIGDFEKAIEYAQDGLRIRQDIHHPTNVEIMASMGIVANIHAAQTNYQLAIDIRNEMLSLLSQSVGESHIFYAIVTSALAQLYELNGEPETSIIFAENAIQRFDRIDAEGHRYAVAPRIIMLEALLAQGDVNKVLMLLEEVKIYAESFHQSGHHFIARLNAIKAIAQMYAHSQTTAAESQSADTELLLQKSMDEYAQTYARDSHYYKKFERRIELLVEKNSSQ